MKKQAILQKKASNNNVNIPSLFIKNLDWKDKDVLTVEYKNGKIIITKEN